MSNASFRVITVGMRFKHVYIVEACLFQQSASVIDIHDTHLHTHTHTNLMAYTATFVCFQRLFIIYLHRIHSLLGICLCPFMTAIYFGLFLDIPR